MDLKPKRKLSSIFTGYILCFGLGTVLLVLIYAALFSVMIYSNMVLPANYYEQKLESSRNTIIKAEKVMPDMIPEGCSYGVYNEAGSMLNGNFRARGNQ